MKPSFLIDKYVEGRPPAFCLHSKLPLKDGLYQCCPPSFSWPEYITLNAMGIIGMLLTSEADSYQDDMTPDP